MKQPLKIVLLTLSLLTAAACTQTGDSEKQITKQYNKIENLIIDHIFETAGPTASQIDEAEKLMVNQINGAIQKLTIIKPQNKVIASFEYHDASGGKLSIYRKLLGETPEGWYVVQDFFQNSNKKRTDPFIIKNKDQLTEEIPEHIEGTFIFWSETGEKELEKKEKNGQKDGLTILYQDGQKMVATNYKNGKEDGVSMGWYENGQKKSMMLYKNGKQDGSHVGWHANGQRKFILDLKEDKLDGPSFNWNESGTKEIYALYRNNIPEGVWITWFENGQKQSEVHFQNGKKHGSQIFWNEDGSLMEARNYKDGEVVKETN